MGRWGKVVLKTFVVLYGVGLMNRALPHGRVTTRHLPGEPPLQKAVVVLEDGGGKQYRTRTDRRGKFFFIINPFSDDGAHVLICAAGHSPMITKGTPVAWFGATYGPDIARPPLRGGLEHYARNQGWRGQLPAECYAAVAETPGGAGAAEPSITGDPGSACVRGEESRARRPPHP
jgi:hypothetical protein